MSKKEKQRYLRIMHCNGSWDNTDLKVGRLLIARMEKTKMEGVVIKKRKDVGPDRTDGRIC